MHQAICWLDTVYQIHSMEYGAMEKLDLGYVGVPIMCYVLDPKLHDIKELTDSI